jgi:Xaa-Pro aminopeptidase
MSNYNSQYISAADDWESLDGKERRDLLHQLGYDRAGSTDWNELPKTIQKQLTRMYPETLYPDETMKLEPGQNYHCEPGYVWVPSFHKKNGDYVHGFCRKKGGNKK